MNRRVFLRQSGAAAASLFLADNIIARPYDPILLPARRVEPIRIRGAVKTHDKGIANVAVTDGLSVTRTAGDGSYELISNSNQAFVSVGLPSGYRIPMNPTGTALFYAPITTVTKGEMTAEFQLGPAIVPDDHHAFLLMADPQTLDPEDMKHFHSESVPDVQSTVKRLSALPLFGVSCGDIMFDRLEYFPDYEKAVRMMGLPCFQVMGNHDVEVAQKTDELSARTFRRYFGPTYYSFNRGEIHYVVLDDIFWFGGYIGYVDQQQLDWLKSDLALIEQGRTVVVFMHIPSYNEQHKRYGERSPDNSLVVTNRELIYRLLESYKSYIVCGHMHESEYLKDGGAEVHVCGTVCGAWWTGPICDDGTPNGYSVYEVRGSNLSWQHKSAGLDVTHQMRLYAPGSDLNSSPEVIANIWCADAQWKIVWYEDGIRNGIMERRNGTDPLSVKLHAGDRLPAKHNWVEPTKTDHLFYAKPSAGAKEVIVEATDRWERVYKESVNLMKR